MSRLLAFFVRSLLSHHVLVVFYDARDLAARELIKDQMKRSRCDFFERREQLPLLFLLLASQFSGRFDGCVGAFVLKLRAK